MIDAGGIALQLYTLRERGATDFPWTLRAAREAGYRAVELAGYGGLSPQQLRMELDGLGLRAISAHVAHDRFAREIDRVVDELHVLGCEQAIVPSIDREQRASVEALARVADEFNEWADRCRREHLAFGYHNHDFEFAMLDGVSILDRLAARTDPALVALQLDLYWVLVGGADPAALIQQHGSRVRSVHAKDRLAGDVELDTSVGDGTMPWPEVLGATKAAGTRWYIVEQEHLPGDPIETIRRSRENLERLLAS